MIIGGINSVDQVINNVQARTLNIGGVASNQLVKAYEQYHIRYKSSPTTQETQYQQKAGGPYEAKKRYQQIEPLTSTIMMSTTMRTHVTQDSLVSEPQMLSA